MTDTVKDQEPDLPPVFTPETEYQLSSIFVDIPRPAVTPVLSLRFFLFTLPMNIQSHSCHRGVMGPEASPHSASSPMVRSVSTRSIFNKVVPGRSTLNTL